MRYTFYVFAPGVRAFDEVLSPGQLTGEHPYQRVPIRGLGFEARAYLQRNKPSIPSWLDFILGFCNVPAPHTVRNRACSFVLAIRTPGGRMCALTYGHGFLALDRSKVQRDFGIDAACRLLDASAIKEIESKATGADALHKLQIASRPGDLATFPLQRARDRVHRLGGTSPDEALGKRLSGATSCMIGGILPFARLGEVCERLVASLGRRPRARLAAVRPSEPVQHEPTIAALRRKLLAALRPSRCRDIGLFLPDVEDWRSIDRFETTADGATWTAVDDLEVGPIVVEARRQVGTRLSLDDLRVRGLSDAGHVILDEPLADLATFDTDYDGKPHALASGRWYLLDQDFVARCDRDAESIEPEPDEDYLPPWTDAHPTELAYNRAAAAGSSGRFVCLDQDEVMVDGRAVEPCDLVRTDGQFVYVKKWESSQTFSALIKQGQNAAALIDASQQFRDGLLEKLPAAWRRRPLWRAFSAGVAPNRLRIVYAVADNANREIPKDLPFFSRLSLLEACGSLRAQYYNVRVFHIQYQRARARRRR